MANPFELLPARPGYTEQLRVVPSEQCLVPTHGPQVGGGGGGGEHSSETMWPFSQHR